jgi:hypothetical protein
LSDILVRGETRTERAAREAADAPVLAFLVIEIFAASGAAVIREHDLPACSHLELTRDLAAGQWNRPHRVLFIDEANGVCRDASAEIAEFLATEAGRTLSLGQAARDFCSRHAQPRSAA